MNCILQGITLNAYDENWRYFNDNQPVEIIQETDVKQFIKRQMQLPQFQQRVTPYVLFYARRDTRQIELPTRVWYGFAENALIEENSELSKEDDEADNIDSVINSKKKFPKDFKKKTEKTAERIKKNYEQNKQNKEYNDKRSQNNKESMRRSREKANVKDRERNYEKSRSGSRINSSKSRESSQSSLDGRRESHRKSKVKHMQRKRSSAEYKESEQEKNTQQRSQKRKELTELNKKYEERALEGPDYLCSCCGCLFFARSVIRFPPKDLEQQPIRENFFNLYMYLKAGEQEPNDPVKEDQQKIEIINEKNVQIFLCHTCKRGLDTFKKSKAKEKKKLLPKLALVNGLRFNKVDDCLLKLNESEIRIISPTHAFYRIQTLGWDEQKGLIGNVVNVPVDIKETISNVLPRNFNDTFIFQLNVKRRDFHQKNYKSDKICPANVIKALRYLLERELFTELKITINDDWINKYQMSASLQDEMNRVKFIIDPEDEKVFEHEEPDNFDQSANTDSYLSQMFKNMPFIKNTLEKTTRWLQANTPTKERNPTQVEFTTSQHTSRQRSISLSTKSPKSSLKSKSPTVFLLEDKDYEERAQKRREADFSDDSESDEEGEWQGKTDYFNANNRYFQYANTLLTQDNDIPEVTKAPAENLQPRFFMDYPFAEESNFIKEYGGDLCKYPKELSYQNRCKSEMRRHDRRMSMNNERIFWSYKFLTGQKFREAVSIACKKKSVYFNGKERDMTAGDARNKEFMQDLFNEDEALSFLRAVRSTPQYWQWAKYKVNAMIRQLGLPTFFITLSPSENNWPELIKLLAEIQAIDPPPPGDINQLFNTPPYNNRKFRIFLLNRDPVTVTRYYENRVRALLKFMHSKYGVFKEHPITDFYWRVDFQYRGSPHVHMMTWNANCPTYQPRWRFKEGSEERRQEMLKEYANFASKYITVHRPDDDVLHDDSEFGINSPHIHVKRVSTKYQLHSHRKNCIIDDDHGNKICKYHFPYPIMEEATCIEPFMEGKKPDDRQTTIDYEKYYKKFGEIQKQLEIVVEKSIHNKHYRISLKDFLKKLRINYNEYLLAISTSIKHATVFLKRTSWEIMMNQYQDVTFKRWRGNMDIQLITDAYGCAIYVTTYMVKTNAQTSRILRQVLREEEKKQATMRNKLNRIANKFQNVHEVSTPEAIYTLCAMPVSYCSREIIFINTYPSNQRTFTMLNEEFLKNKDENSLDIWQKNILNRYAKRPDDLEDLCLAEFAAWYTIYTKAAYELLMSKRVKNQKEEEEEDEDLFDETYFNWQVLKRNNEEQKIAEELHINAENSDDEEENLKSYLKKESNYRELKDNLGYVCRRTRARILRYKRYTFNTDKFNYFRVQILLYYPWRDENNDVECNMKQDKIADKFLEKDVYQVIEKNKQKFEISDCVNIELLQEEIEEAIWKHNNDEEEREAAKRNAIEKFNRKNHPNKEIDPDDTINEYVPGSQLDIEYLEEMYGYAAEQEDIFELNPAKNETNMPIATPRRMNDQDYNKLMCGLNEKQQIYMMNFVRLIKTNESFYHFIRGGAGTGKSFLIKAIYQTLVRLAEKDKPNTFIEHDKTAKKIGKTATTTIDDDQPLYCLIAAYTAKAAFNVGGDTFVRCFSLQTMQIGGKKANQERMAESARLKMYQKYRNVKLIIIEEVSMISSAFFHRANERIQIIFNNHDKPFAGIPVICVGDFNQLPPMMGQFVFTPGDNHYRQFVNNPLWAHFRLIELTEIMRVNPDEIEFAKALNALGEHGTLGLDNKQIQMFNARIKNIEYFDNNERDAIFIFYLNSSVQERNERIIKNHPGQLFNCPAIDFADGRDKNQIDIVQEELNKLHTDPETIKNVYEACKLPQKLQFKVGIKYMITKNLNTSDGIVNGATCILKYLETHRGDLDDDKVPAVRKVYMDFENIYIGQTMRERARKNDKYKYDQNVDKTWTPIDFYKHMIKHFHYSYANFTLNRIQYPLEPAEALTIHKSQGQTFQKVAVCIDTEQKMDRAKLYVAISRVTSLRGLFLFGSETIVPPSERNLSLTERQKRIKENAKTSKIAIEMLRLRTNSKFENIFDFMEKNYMNSNQRRATGTITIMFQNIQTMSESKKNVIEKDLGFKNSDLIHFVSTGMKPNHRVNITLVDYKKIIETTCNKMPSHQFGTLTYVWKEKEWLWRVVFTNSEQDTHEYKPKKDHNDVEVTILKCSPIAQQVDYSLYVCFVYKHPETSIKEFIEQIKIGLRYCDYEANTYPKDLIIIGDYNIDFNKTENKKAFTSFKVAFNVEPLITKEPTNNHGNQIDWMFATNVDQLTFTAKTYETFQSDHKPLFLRIKCLKK
jgi:hypothetical protein